MKIEIWSDYVCPFCYLGKRHLETALQQFSHRDQVKIEYMSFELDPKHSIYSGQSIYEELSKKYGMSMNEARISTDSIKQYAASIGLVFNFDQAKTTNTLNAHRLTHYAKGSGLEKELAEKLFSAYFTESKLISDHEVLLEIANSIGLDQNGTMAVLKTEAAYKDDVRRDEAFAQQLGVTGVPFFLINQKHAVTGAQPPDILLNAIEKAWEEFASAQI